MSHKRYSLPTVDVKCRTITYKPVPQLTEAEIAAFWQRIRKDPETGCWIWQAGSRKSGKNDYGIVYLRGVAFLTHRVSYTLTRGPIPDDLTLDHLRESKVCSTTLCGNPCHLEPVSRAENARRMQAPKLKPTCKWGHPRETGKPCRGCNVMNVAKSQAKRADYYRELKAQNKRDERARKRTRRTEAA